ncbi:MAG: CDP-alcohol phosphatidyltransferase family protein [Elusimicrobia bacterium]|nr:CDP-alcohol phosphatidyltransferase family protein [Elusimicrobiota bacterium]
MITSAGLWISHPKLLLERIGGMTVLERQLWTLTGAGIKKVAVAARPPSPDQAARLRLPEGLEVSWLGKAGAHPLDGSAPAAGWVGSGGEMMGVSTPYLSLSGQHFVRPETLRYVITAPYKTHASFIDHLDLSVMQVVPFRTEDMVTAQRVPLPAGSSVFLDASDLRQGPIMDWLLSMGFKSHDGFMARHFDRHISLAITRAIIETRISPNFMTVVSCLIGLAGAALFLLTPSRDAAAAALVWLHSVLDGCDGEMARIRFQESRLGGDIDFWGDNLVHVSLFACLAAGMARAGHAVAPALGLAAVVGIIGSATLAFWHRVEARRKGPAADVPSTDASATAAALARIEAILAQRDFIYLLLAMAFLDLTYYFLWAGAVGAPLFFAIMLGAGKAPAGAQSAAKAPGEA